MAGSRQKPMHFDLKVYLEEYIYRTRIASCSFSELQTLVWESVRSHGLDQLQQHQIRIKYEDSHGERISLISEECLDIAVTDGEQWHSNRMKLYVDLRKEKAVMTMLGCSNRDVTSMRQAASQVSSQRQSSLIIPKHAISLSMCSRSSGSRNAITQQCATAVVSTKVKPQLNEERGDVLVAPRQQLSDGGSGIWWQQPSSQLVGNFSDGENEKGMEEVGESVILSKEASATGGSGGVGGVGLREHQRILSQTQQRKEVEELRGNSESDECVQQRFLAGPKCSHCLRNLLCKFKHKHQLIAAIISAKISEALPLLTEAVARRRKKQREEKVEEVLVKQQPAEASSQQTPLPAHKSQSQELDPYYSSDVLQGNNQIAPKMMIPPPRREEFNLHSTQQVQGVKKYNKYQRRISAGMNTNDPQQQQKTVVFHSSDSVSVPAYFKPQKYSEYETQKILATRVPYTTKDSTSNQYDLHKGDPSKRRYEGKRSNYNSQTSSVEESPLRWQAELLDGSSDQILMVESNEVIVMQVKVRNIGKRRWKAGCCGVRCVEGIFNSQVCLWKEVMNPGDIRTLNVRLQLPDTRFSATKSWETLWQLELLLNEAKHSYQLLSPVFRVTLTTVKQIVWKRFEDQLILLQLKDTSQEEIKAFLKETRLKTKPEDINGEEKEASFLNRIAHDITRAKDNR